MPKINKHIEIVRSTRIGLSSLSQVSSCAMLDALSKHYARVHVSTVNDLDDLSRLVLLKPDLVFLGMKFITTDNSRDIHNAEKIWLSEYLDKYEIAYTGSDREAHELEINKPASKQRVIDDGLKSSPFFVAKQAKNLSPKDVKLTYPLFVKPSNRGGGLGIDDQSVVYNFDQLFSKVQSIKDNYRADSLVEEYLPGREFSVAILWNQVTNILQAMPIELSTGSDSRGVSMLSRQVKSSNKETVKKIPDTEIKNSVIKLAVDVFKSLGARDYGRVDIRLNADDVPYFLEANLIPSLIAGYGSFPKACMLNTGTEYEQMLVKIADLGLTRSDRVKAKLLLINTRDNFTKPSFESVA